MSGKKKTQQKQSVSPVINSGIQVVTIGMEDEGVSLFENRPLEELSLPQREQLRKKTKMYQALNAAFKPTSIGTLEDTTYIQAGSLVIDAHSSRDRYSDENGHYEKGSRLVGGKTAKQLAAEIDERIVAGKTNGAQKAVARRKLEHIYLLSCEAGYDDSRADPCFARQLTKNLYKKGFHNIKVHAITSPSDFERNEYNGMKVGIEYKDGLFAGKGLDLKLGGISAQIVNEKYEINSNGGPIKTTIVAKKNFMATNDALSEFNRAENTFAVNERKHVFSLVGKTLAGEIKLMEVNKAFAVYLADPNHNDNKPQELVNELINAAYLIDKTPTWVKMAHAITKVKNEYDKPNAKLKKDNPGFYALLENLTTIANQAELTEAKEQGYSSNDSDDDVNNKEIDAASLPLLKPKNSQTLHNARNDEVRRRVNGDSNRRIENGSTSEHQADIDFVSQYYKYATNDRGRSHKLAVSGNFKGKDLTGDAYKTQILDHFATAISTMKAENFKTQLNNKLEAFKDNYQTLITGQDSWTNYFRNKRGSTLFRTDSEKALKAMFKFQAGQLEVEGFDDMYEEATAKLEKSFSKEHKM